MSKPLPWGIHRIADMVSDRTCAQSILVPTKSGGRRDAWVTAVPLPYAANLLQRLRAAWWVLRGQAHAVRWPKPGELEHAMGALPDYTDPNWEGP